MSHQEIIDKKIMLKIMNKYSLATIKHDLNLPENNQINLLMTKKKKRRKHKFLIGLMFHQEIGQEAQT